jgi:hypothetical protein
MVCKKAVKDLDPDALVPAVPAQAITAKRPRDEDSDELQARNPISQQVAGPSTVPSGHDSSDAPIVKDPALERETAKAKKIKMLQVSPSQPSS